MSEARERQIPILRLSGFFHRLVMGALSYRLV